MSGYVRIFGVMAGTKWAQHPSTLQSSHPYFIRVEIVPPTEESRDIIIGC